MCRQWRLSNRRATRQERVSRLNRGEEVWFSLHARSSYSSAPQAEHARHCRSWREFCVGAHGVTSNEDELHTVHAKQRLSSDAEQLPSA